MPRAFLGTQKLSGKSLSKQSRFRHPGRGRSPAGRLGDTVRGDLSKPRQTRPEGVSDMAGPCSSGLCAGCRFAPAWRGPRRARRRRAVSRQAAVSAMRPLRAGHRSLYSSLLHPCVGPGVQPIITRQVGLPPGWHDTFPSCSPCQQHGMHAPAWSPAQPPETLA